MSVFLGIDLGASALKACLVSASGEKLAQARASYPTHMPQTGHSEQNPQDWVDAMRAALATLKNDAGAAFSEITGISFSGGAHIAVLCDAAGNVLRPAILWSDQRAAMQAGKLNGELTAGSTVQDIAGNAPNATWTLPQLIWLQAHEPEIIVATEKLYFAKDWLAAQMTDAHVSDKSEAVGSLMADKTGQWHDDLCRLSGIQKSALPALIDIGAPCGEVTAKAAEVFSLPLVPVYQGAIDTSMEWLCAAPLDAQTASLKLASAGVIAFTTNEPQRFPPVSYYPHIVDGLSYHAAGMSDCMGAIDYVRQSFTPTLDMAAFEAKAAAAKAGAEGLLFYPYLSGARAPFWDAELRASWHGLTRAHDQSAVARAAYEGVGHVLTAIWHDMTDKLGHKPDSLHVLGGGGESDFFCQMLADMMAVTIKRGVETDCAFATALFAAASHHGIKAEDLTKTAYLPNGEFTPDKAAHAVYAFSHQAFMARHEQ